MLFCHKSNLKNTIRIITRYKGLTRHADWLDRASQNDCLEQYKTEVKCFSLRDHIGCCFTNILATSILSLTITDRSIRWKSDLTDKMKHTFFQAAVVSIMLYGCTTWTLTKRLEKKLDGNYTRILRAILYKSWRQHPTGHQLYGHLPPITKTIQVRRTRHAGYCWRSRDKLTSDVHLWTPRYGRAKAGRPARTYIHTAAMWGCGM